MSDDEPASEIDRLLDQLFERERDHRAALEEICEAHPEHAEELRKRVARLEAHGVLEPSARPATFPRVGDRFGPWRLNGVLGRGAMGLVFDATRDGEDGEPVALKLILPTLEEVGRERFEREALSLQSIDHPNVCRLIEFGDIDGTPWIAMERIDGPSLADRIFEARGDLADVATAEDVARMGAKLARGLAASHEHGVVHRDVKPANVLLRGGEEPVLIDFGLARLLERDRITESRRPIGTPAYMAPEQVRGADVDARSDVYSLGAVLFELLTLRPPFDSASREDLFRRILSDDVESPRRRNPSIPKPLVHIVWKCLEKDPRRRYASGEPLAEDLDRFLAGRSVVARPPSPLRLAARRVRRHPVGVLGAVAVGLAFALLLAIAQNDRLVREAYAGSLLAGLYSERYGDAEALGVAADAFTRYPSLQTRSQFYRLLVERRVTSSWTTDGSSWLHAAPSPDGTTLAIAAAPDQPEPFAWVEEDGVGECPFDRVVVAQGGHVEWDSSGERVAVLASKRGVRVLDVTGALTSTDYRLPRDTETRSYLRPARCMAFDAAGDLWVGTEKGGLSRLKDGQVDSWEVFPSRADVLAVASDGPWLVVASRKGEVAVVDGSGEVVARPIDASVLADAGIEDDNCDRLVLDVARRRLVVARGIDRNTRAFDCRLEAWSLPAGDALLQDAGELVAEPTDLQDRSVDLCVFDADGRTGHAAITRTGMLWTGDERGATPMRTGAADALTLSFHGGLLVMSTSEGKVVLVHPDGEVLARFVPSTDAVTDVVSVAAVVGVVPAMHDGSAYALCQDGRLATFDLRPRDAASVRPIGDGLFAARWGIDEGEFLTGMSPHRFGRWSRDGTLQRESFLGMKPGLHRIAVARDSGVVVAAVEGVLDLNRLAPAGLVWFDPDSLEVQQTVAGPMRVARWRDLAFSPDEETLFAVDGNRLVRLRRNEGSEEWEDEELAVDTTGRLVYEHVSVTDRIVVTTGLDGDVEVFDHCGEPLVDCTFEEPPTAVAAWSEDAYVGFRDGRVLILRLDDLSDVGELEPHPSSVNRIALAPALDPAAARPVRLAVGGATGFVSVRRGPNLTRWLEFDASAGVVDLDWSRAGDELLLATSDGRVRVLPKLDEARLRESADQLGARSE